MNHMSWRIYIIMLFLIGGFTYVGLRMYEVEANFGEHPFRLAQGEKLPYW